MKFSDKNSTMEETVRLNTYGQNDGHTDDECDIRFSVSLDEGSSATDDDRKHDDDASVQKVTWGGQAEFLFSVIGYTVGLSNIWRFPYYVYKNGGGVAFIPFLLFLFLCGGPMYYIEVCLGQFSGKSALGVWEICPMFKGIGMVMAMLSTIYIWYFGMCFGWVIYYLIQSCYPTIPWSTCNNDWNTDACIDATTNLTAKAEAMNTSLTDAKFSLSSFEFWENNVLAKSSGIHDMGSVQLHLVGCLALGWGLVFLCLIKGVQSLGKVVYVTATLPYLLLTILLIKGLTLDGAMDGISVYLRPDFSRLMTAQIWIEAAVQCFFSLGPAFGGIVAMASFNKFRHNIVRDTVIVCFADGFTGFYGGLVVFSVLGFLSKETGTPIEKLPFSGPALAFITYPEALSRLPLPNLWAVLFFVTLVFIGIDSVFGSFEAVVNVVIDMNYRRLHPYRTLINGAFTVILIVSTLPLTMSGGVYVFLLTDWYCATFNTVATALVEVIVVAWIYGAARFGSDIELMTGNKPSIIIRVLWCFVIPIFLLCILVTSALFYSTPDYGDGYEYPPYAVTIGNIIAFGPLVGLFVVAVLMVLRDKSETLPQKLRSVSTPSFKWLPNDKAEREVYKQKRLQSSEGLKKRFLVDILGLN